MISHEELIDILTACSISCKKCANACLQESDLEKFSKCVKLNLDCGGITALSVELAVRGSDLLDKQLIVCIEICRLCAEECEKHLEKSHCQTCASICRNCETICHSYMHQPVH